MRAWQIQAGDGIDGLAIAELADPIPGPGQVLVQVKANSVNFRDLAIVSDPVARGMPMGRIPNSDGAGEVIAIGEGVTQVKIGDRVAGCFFQQWQDGNDCSDAAMSSAMGGAIDGMLAEKVVLNEYGVVAIPDNLSFEEAACLPCAALTAWRALVPVGAVKAGDTVLLLGTGGVSIFALQFAALMGARPIITSSSDEKLKRAKELGAWQTINYKTHPDWEKQVLELTNQRGVDLTVETGGGGTLAKSVLSTRVSGKIGLIGVLTGGQIDPTAIMRKSITLQGIYVGSQRHFNDMNAAITAGALKPVIDLIVPFDQAPQAYKAMKAAGHFGKIVISF